MPKTLSLEQTTRLVARSLGLSVEALRTNFRAAERNDLPGVVALRAPLFAQGAPWDDHQYLAWRYHFGEPARGRGDFWVLLLGGKVIAGIGTQRVRYFRNGVANGAVALMDIVVATEYHDAGLGLWMNLSLAHRERCLMIFGDNENSAGIVARFFKPVCGQSTFVYLLDAGSAIGKQLSSPLLGTILGKLAKPVLSLWQRWALRGIDQTIAVRQVTRFDESAAAMFQQCRRRDEYALERSADYLNWRVFDNPRERYAVFGAYRGNDLLGYVVLRHPRSDDRSGRMAIVDWRTQIDAGQSILQRLLSNCTEYARTHGANALVASFAHGESERLIAQWGFVRRPHQESPFAIRCLDSTEEALLAKGIWQISALDGDVD